MASKNEKRVTYSNTKYVLDPVTGEVNATLDERTFRVGAEEDYVKIYFCGIHYLSDIPSEGRSGFRYLRGTFPERSSPTHETRQLLFRKFPTLVRTSCPDGQHVWSL